MMNPWDRPVGYYNKKVIVVLISAPYRKPQVIAYNRPDLPAFYFQLNPILARRIMLIFFPIREQVFFIIRGCLAIWPCAVKPIVVVGSILDGYTSGNSCFPFFSFL